MTGVTAAQVHERDQADMAIRDMDTAWPYNVGLMDDDEVRNVVFERLAQPWPDGLPMSKSYLIWAHGPYVEVAADSMVIVAVTLQTAPARGECDRCRCLKPIAGVAVVPVPINLVPLVLCHDCADHLNPESLLQIGVTDA